VLGALVVSSMVPYNARRHSRRGSDAPDDERVRIHHVFQSSSTERRYADGTCEVHEMTGFDQSTSSEDGSRGRGGNSK